MKAADFRYERPGTIDEALALMADKALDAAALAGGQSLMPMMNFRMAQPETLVDLGSIDALRGITRTGKALRIGAMTRYADLERSAEIAKYAPLIPMALPYIAHSAIRNRGTIGGSLALADPAAEMPALMLALGATITAQGADSSRDIAADEFFLGVYETALRESELITSVTLPIADTEHSFGFYEIARRHGDYAMAGVAVAATGAGYRIAFFSVADRAVRARAAEAILKADPDAVDAAVASLDEIEFAADLNAAAKTKRHLAGVVLRRALDGMRP